MGTLDILATQELTLYFLSWQAFLLPIMQPDIVLGHGKSGEVWWLCCPSRGQCCHVSQGRGYRKQEGCLDWAGLVSWLSMPRKASLTSRPQNQLLPWLPPSESSQWIKLLSPSPVYWFPWSNTWTNLRTLCHVGCKEAQGGFPDWKQELLPPFLFAQNYSRAGSAVDIRVTT